MSKVGGPGPDQEPPTKAPKDKLDSSGTESGHRPLLKGLTGQEGSKPRGFKHLLPHLKHLAPWPAVSRHPTVNGY